MSVKDTIDNKLRSAFSPDLLEVIDESEQHRGHGGWREGGETHFRVRMIAKSLEGLNRVARQRAVNQCLAQELSGSVHALAMELDVPRN